MSTAERSGLSRHSVERLSTERGEPEWLREYRLAAWERFEALPRPSTLEKGWRRTDLSRFDLDALMEPAARPGRMAGAENLGDLTEGAGESSGLLALRNGQVARQELDPSLAARGVRLLTLSEAVERSPELVRDFFSQERAAKIERSFDALAAALWSSGFLLLVPRGVVVQAPIQVVHWSDDAAPSISFSLVIACEQSNVTVVERHVSPPERADALAVGTALVELGAAARVTFVQLQERDEQAWSFCSLTSEQERDSAMSWLLLGLGGRLSRVELDTRLNGQGSEADLVGLVFGGGDQQFDLQSTQEHIGSDTRSDLLLKVALRDRARSNFSGLIRIEERSLRTSSNQVNRNLLLSAEARADADPRLEILNSDVVRCGHGATVGPVDQETLFYLMTRGLSEEAAERLIVEGFFQPLIDQIPIKSVRERVLSSISRKLGG